MQKLSAGLAGLFLTALAAAPAGASPSAPPPAASTEWVAAKKSVALPNGVILRYLDLGNPNGPAVLLLHGWSDSSRSFADLAGRLPGRRLIIPDQRGHGGSSAPECCYGFDDLAWDGKLLLDALGIERAAVVGHSLGSGAGQVLAARWPERVSALVLIGSSGRVFVERGDWLHEQVSALDAPPPVDGEFLAAFQATNIPIDPALTKAIIGESAAVPLQVWRGVLGEVTSVRPAAYAPDVRAPVLVVHGAEDPLFGPAHLDALRAAYPRAEVVVLPKLGHSPHWERPAEVGAAIARFLDAR